MDLLGNFGGFMEVVVILFSIFGSRFSAASLRARIVEANFV